jgi:hypothetical protein
MSKQTRNEETNKNQTNKQKLQVQDQQNFSLSLSSGVTPPVASPGVGI